MFEIARFEHEEHGTVRMYENLTHKGSEWVVRYKGDTEFFDSYIEAKEEFMNRIAEMFA